jgi:MSHA biogenesis protein MshQ
MKRLMYLALRLLALLLLSTANARADTPITLWKAFDGRVNFTGTQVTLRTGPNTSSPCTVYTTGTNRVAKLTIPTGATVLSAQLYWAGSGAADYTVTFESRDITATRQYTSETLGNGLNYFSGAADVTAIVKLKGSGDYNFSGLSVATGSPWCNSQGVLGGFSLLVVYSLPAEPQRVLNIYEGFRFVQNGEIAVDANNFRWNRTAFPVEEKARVGHITWEGDPTLSQNGEQLEFEGKEMIDRLNPSGNQFNSTSNINNSDASWGIDFDAYDTTVKIWSGDDATVRTVYKAAQDLVLLNAEVLLVPTEIVSDLSISIARAGALKVGADVQYKVTVTNNGPTTESGAITVTNTLPAGMYYTTGTVTGWTCSATTTAGTCTYRSGLAPGASAPVLTVYTRVTSSGEKANMVKVTGTTTDDNLANNTATDTGTATNADGSTTLPTVPPSYIFTNSECKPNIAIGVAGQTCKAYSANTVGGKDTPIWLTAINDKGVPVAADSKNDLNVSFQFMLVCNNPTTGKVGASYAGAAIPVCSGVAAPAWSNAVTVKFAKGVVSVSQNLNYKDVGKITLGLKETSGTAATEVFVSAPAQLGFRRISYKGKDNPGTKTGAGTAFAPAGAMLDVEVGALLYDKVSYAPNFGNEVPRPRVSLDHSTNAEVSILDSGKLIESDTFSWAGGIVTTKAGWSEVGAINFTTGLLDPDNSGNTAYDKLYFGVSVSGSTTVVGRFYPAYFKTEVTGPFNCPANLPDRKVCPSDALGAVYSRQPFKVAVQAYNDANERVRNFGGKEWFRAVTLSAVAQDGAVVATNLTPKSGSADNILAAATEIKNADGTLKAYEIETTPSYQLPNPYNYKSLPPTAVGDPARVHVRAVAADSAVTGNVQINSQRGGVGTTEDGILVLSGRLKLPNALGTDILPTLLGVRAEYWAGATAGWLFNAGYADPLGGPVTAAFITDQDCSAGFRAATEICTDLVNASGAGNVVMTAGTGKLRIRAPGKLPGGGTRGGTVTLRYGGWGWLPSTVGRINFSSHRSPVIYVREMYY